MAITKEQLPTSILNRGLLGNIVPEKTAGRQMEELQGQMGSPKTPQQNIALGEFQAKPQPFTPDARYYPNVSVPDRLDFVPGNTFPSPAQAYMAEAAAERAMAEVAAERAAKEKSVPGPTTTPYTALKDGLGAGEAISLDRSDGNFISGLLGDINWKAITDRLIKTFQRPEMLTPGVSPLTAFAASGAALNQAEMAGAVAEQERMDKIMLEQLKNAPGAPKITSEAVKLYDRVNTSRANAALVQKMKQALIEGPGTGGIGTGEQALKAMLNALNIPIGTSGRSDYNSLLAELKTGMLRTGRLMKADFKLLEEQLPGSGTFTNRDQLLNALRKVEEKSNRQLYEDQQILKTFGLPAGSGAMPSTMIRSRNN